jgi:hypothetical protein
MTSQKICIVDMNMTNHGGVEKVSANLANGLADYYNVFYAARIIHNMSSLS